MKVNIFILTCRGCDKSYNHEIDVAILSFSKELYSDIQPKSSRKNSDHFQSSHGQMKLVRENIPK